MFHIFSGLCFLVLVPFSKYFVCYKVFGYTVNTSLAGLSRSPHKYFITGTIAYPAIANTDMTILF